MLSGNQSGAGREIDPEHLVYGIGPEKMEVNLKYLVASESRMQEILNNNEIKFISRDVFCRYLNMNMYDFLDAMNVESILISSNILCLVAIFFVPH